jgi:hypothetical protein
MATYSAAATDQGVFEKTLAAATVDTVTLNRIGSLVSIVTDGTSSISVSVDGVTSPTVAGQAFYYIPAIAGVYQIRVPTASGGAQVLKLISAATPKYSVATGYQLQTGGG